MKVEERLAVARPPDAVWALFCDVPEVVQCLPGAELLKDLGDARYEGRVTVRLGPVNAAFGGEATVHNDAEARRGRIEGKGVDRKSGSRGSIAVTYQLTEIAAGTEVHFDADIVLSGPAAQFGRPGLVRELSARILRDFAKNLEARLAAPSGAPAAGEAAGADGTPPPLPHREVHGLSLLLGSVLGLVRNFFAGLFGRR